MTQWYYKSGSETKGPISDKRFKRLVATRKLKGTDQVCCDGMKDWASVESLDLTNSEATKTVPPPLAPPKQSNPPVHSTPAKPVPDERDLREKQISLARAARNRSDRNLLIACVSGLGICFVAIIWFMVSQQSETPQAKAKKKTSLEGLSVAEVKRANAEEQAAQKEKPNGNEEVASSDSNKEENERPANESADASVSGGSKNSNSSLIGPDEPQPVVPIGDSTNDSKPTEEESPKSVLPNIVNQSPDETPDVQPKRSGLQDPGIVEVFQELEVVRKPKFVVQGLPFDQNLQYKVMSQYRVGRLSEDGSRDVEQTILEARLISADPMSRKALSTAIDELAGKKFSFQLNSLQEVVDFKGGKKSPKVIDVKKPFDILDTEGFRVTSVIDDDGWKELAQLSFFVPHPQDPKWVGQIHHDWGELGNWDGTTDYTRGETTRKLLQVSYQHNLRYSPLDEAVEASKFPFKIDGTKFKAEKAGGSIQFDTVEGRVDSAVETFNVSGEVEASALGTTAKIQIMEQQLFKIRLLDQNIWQQ